MSTASPRHAPSTLVDRPHHPETRPEALTCAAARAEPKTVPPARRRRRVVIVLVSATTVTAVFGSVESLRSLWWLTAVLGALSCSYLAKVAALRRCVVERDMAAAGGVRGATWRTEWQTEWEWDQLGRPLATSSGNAASDGSLALVVVAPAETPRDNAREELTGGELLKFLALYVLGWVLAPPAAIIRWRWRRLAELPGRGLAQRLVWVQQRSRAQSLRLVAIGALAGAGATSLSVAAATGAAATVPTASASSQAPGTTYVVQPGDTLSSIAARYGTTAAALATANAIADPNLIYAGQTLVVSASSAVPTASASSQAPGTTYVVQPGDTLSSIAARYGTTAAALATANAIADPNLIYAGQSLVVSASGAAAVGAATGSSTGHLGGGHGRPGGRAGGARAGGQALSVGWGRAQRL